MRHHLARAWRWVLAGALIVIASACDMPTGLPVFQSIFVVPTENVVMPVTGFPGEQSVNHDLSGVDNGILDEVTSGAIVVEVDNPFGAVGVVELRFSNASTSVQGDIDIGEGGEQTIPMTGDQIRALLGTVITIRGSGQLCATEDCELGSFDEVTLRNRIEFHLEIGGDE